MKDIVVVEVYVHLLKENKMKKRVKCANCGMVYDIKSEGDMVIIISPGICPKCGSNAYDVLKNYQEIWRQFGEIK